jgi:hypothetical protein
MISTRDLSKLPDVAEFRRRLQSLALLDAILCPRWEYRFYSFNCRWAPGEEMGSMRNGHGDDFFALFDAHGCFLKGFWHESPMSPYRGVGEPTLWPGLIETVPVEFQRAVREPAFGVAETTTFCIWRLHTDEQWRRGHVIFPAGRDPDGSAYLLSPLDGDPATYSTWAALHFDKPFLTPEMVKPIMEHRPLTDAMVAALTPDIVLDVGECPHLTVADIIEEVEEIGYPVESE